MSSLLEDVNIFQEEQLATRITYRVSKRYLDETL